MRKGLTEIVFILDRSGSMRGLVEDTIGGFNAMMEKQKKETEGGEAIVSTVIFDDKMEVLYDRIPIQDVPVMTEEDYWVRGCTALLDAVGTSIHHIGNVHKYARDEDRPEKTLFIITTDGMENASRHYSYRRVKEMVERQQNRYGWEFIFIGANIDAAQEAAKFGMRRERAVNYVHDSQGTASVYASVSKAMRAVRCTDRDHCEEILNMCEWDADIRNDYQKRGKKHS